MSSQLIRQLPEDIINRIAAGEVVERPASAVKELLDNSIDAGAKNIQISIKDGGERLIEVIDDGSGIPEEQIQNAFKPHSTSKITNFDDLNELLTLGFRGEALSTIASVSSVEVISKTQEIEHGYLATIENGEVLSIKPNPREIGTTVRVKELFKNIPARAKYMRKAQTEYKYILSVLTPYFLIYPNIRFKLFNDEKLIYDLHSTEANSIFDQKRIADTLRSDFTENMMPLLYDGAGIKINGYIAHPKYHSSRTSHQYLFVNSRPVTDRGVIRAVIQGCGSYIPRGEKLPFVLNISISPSSVDVNVHPRKEEVRFLNPYRVYSAIEESVKKTLEKEIGHTSHIDNLMTEQDSALIRFRDEGPISDLNRMDNRQRSSMSSRGIVNEQFSSNFSVDPSKLYESGGSDQFLHAVDQFDKSDQKPVNVFQVFRKYLFYEFTDELWVMDQHAAAERITFERLKSNIRSDVKDIQELLIPETMSFSEKEIQYFEGIKEQLNTLGFTIGFGADSITVSSIPAQLSSSDIKGLFTELIEEDLSDEVSNVTVDDKVDDLIATVACHNSIRTEQKLHSDEIVSLLEQLLQCNNPYSCPHGRPIIWKQRLDQLDAHFDRTY